MTRSTALNLAGKVVGHADGDAGAAFIDRDQRRNAATEPLLHAVDFAAQVLGIEAFDHLAEEGVAADLLGARSFGLAATAHRQRLLGVGQLALEPAALLDQRGDAGRDFVGRGLQRWRRFPQLLVALH